MADISYTYSIPYFLMFTGSFFLWLIGEHCSIQVRCTIANIVLPIVFFLFWGMRGYVATDWKVYYPLFTTALSSDILAEENIEIGFGMLVKALRAITSSYWVYQGALTAINIILLRSIFSRYSKNPGLSWVIWIACFPCVHDLQRNILAVLICLWGMRYVEKRSFWKYAASVGVAFSFHRSTAIFLPLYFFVGKRFDMRIYIFVIAICVANLFVGIPVLKFASSLSLILNRNPDEYLLGNYAESVFKTGKHIVTVMPIAIVGLLLTHSFKVPRIRAIISYNLFLIYLICYCMMQGNGEIQKRLVMMFEWSACLTMPWVLSWRREKMFRICFVTYVLFFCARHCMSYNNVMWRYENVMLMQPTDFDDRAAEIEDTNKIMSTRGGD